MTTIVKDAVAVARNSTAFGDIRPGIILRKEAPSAVTDSKAATENALMNLSKELGDITALLEKSKKDSEQQFTDLTAHYSGVKADNDELKAQVKKHADEYAELVTKHQTLTQALDQVKKELDAPVFKGGKDLEDSDKKAAIELQRRVFLSKGGIDFDFNPDMDNLVIAKDYRSAAYKLMAGGIETKENIVRRFSDAEKKAFEMSSLDSAFFMPEMLGIELNCIVECAELLDLYDSVTVGRTNFMYPKVTDYGSIGTYDCDAKCDAELGPEGNISWLNGRVNDFRGVFCFQRKVLSEANYDFLGFMMRAAARSHRINRNRALMTGDGVNEPLGWMTADCFPKFRTAGLAFTPQDFRRFITSAPAEYGPITVVMHQNVFSYLASSIDNNGRFIFGDGLMTYNPNDTTERIRISNCLPDATAGGTRGNTANPFVAGDFLAAAGNWETAVAAVNKRPMFMEQFIGGSSAWCVKYQFGAEDGGFIKCCDAVRTLTVGA